MLFFMETKNWGTAFNRLLWESSAILSVALGCFISSGCIRQIDGSARSHNVSLEENQLETHGLAFITPTSVTGQEEARQILALIFTDTLAKKRPSIPLLTLSETLGSINRNGMAIEYKTMFEDYHFTGIFNRDTLLRSGR